MDGHHWHAYAWTGRERPPDKARRNPDSPLPPLDINQWLLKPRAHVLATHPMPDGHAAAYAWLCRELDLNPRGPHDLTPDVQLAYAADCLTRQADVVWGYWSHAGRYVSRALITCPRPGIPCPLEQHETAAPLAKDPRPSLLLSPQQTIGGLPA